MKKKTIISVLLAILTMNGWAQLKSGLDLCLRDEATGEWLIGLFDEYAIYDCEYWNYAEVGNNRVVLACGNQQKEVRLKKNAIVIDGVKHKISELTTKFLPDYPSADETAFDATWLDDVQDATLRVVHGSGKADIGVSTFLNHLVKDEQVSYNGQTDSLGRYEARIKVIGQTSSMLYTRASPMVYHLGNWVWIPYILTPGEKLLFYVDDVKGRIYVMGKNARMTNEFLNYPMYGFNADYKTRMGMDFANFITTYDKENLSLNAHRDSVLAAHPKLSRHYKDFTAGEIASFFASDLAQLRFSRAKVKRDVIIDEAKRRNLFNIDVPYLIMDRYHNFLDDISEMAIEKHCTVSSGVPFLQYILQKSREGKVKLSADEVRLIESELPAVAAIEVPSLEKLDSMMVGITGFYLTDTLTSLFHGREDLASEMNLYNQRKEIQALDSLLALPSLLREIAIARKMHERLSHDVNPLTKEAIKVTRENVHQPYLLGEVLKANDLLVEARKAAETIVTPDPRPLAELTDGEDIFRKIVEPFRGRYIYLDVWGTWCSPCKEMMTYVPAMKEQLKDLDLVYLYLCNESSDESWKNAISMFHLNGENCIHYNLPQAQQSALERYIGVNGYPTYKIVLPNGHLLPSMAPRPDHPESIRYIIEETKNNK